MTMTNLDIVIYGTTTLRITTFSKAFKKRDIHSTLSHIMLSVVMLNIVMLGFIGPYLSLS